MTTSVTRWGLLGPLDAARRPLPWPEKLLIVGPAGLGDTVVALPALRRILRAAPATHLTWAGREVYRPLVASMGAHAFAASDAAAGIDARGFDAILAFADVGAGLFGGIERLAAVPVRIGRAAARARPRWCNHLVHASRFGWPRHEAQRDLRLLLPFGQGQPATADELLREGRLAPATTALLPGDLIGAGHTVLHPFSMGHGREWPLGHWIELARLLATDGRAVVFTGSAAERERLAAAWPQALRPAGVVDACGRLDIAQLSVLLHRARAVVAASTGPLHLAAALGTPTLGLFAPRKGVALDRWAAHGSAAVSVQAHRRCPHGRRCQNGACECMNALTVGQVALSLQTGSGRIPRLDALERFVVVAPAAARTGQAHPNRSTP
jgi:ADP-heptose:LPS heptosyltransferase